MMLEQEEELFEKDDQEQDEEQYHNLTDNEVEYDPLEDDLIAENVDAENLNESTDLENYENILSANSDNNSTITTEMRKNTNSPKLNNSKINSPEINLNIIYKELQDLKKKQETQNELLISIINHIKNSEYLNKPRAIVANTEFTLPTRIKRIEDLIKFNQNLLNQDYLDQMVLYKKI